MFTATETDIDDDFSADEFYTEVAEVLEQTLTGQPHRQDLRLKLLEVYATSGRRDAFAAAAREYDRQMQQGAGGDWDQIEDMARSLLVDTGAAGDDADDNGRTRRFADPDSDAYLADQLARLSRDYEQLRKSPSFLRDLDADLAALTGHAPPMLYPARRLSADNGGARLFIAREDPQEAFGRKMANALGQARVAVQRGRSRLLAASVSGQQAVAAASAAAHLDLTCRVVMRRADATRNAGRVALARRLGAEVMLLDQSTQPDSPESQRQYATVLNEVRETALAQWLEAPDQNQFVNGLAAGPEPFTAMTRDFNAGNGRTVRQQIVNAERQLPDLLVAGLDAGLEAFHLFVPFLGYRSIRLMAVPDRSLRRDGGDEDSEWGMLGSLYSSDQVAAADRIQRAQGFPNTQREHAWLRATGRVTYLDEETDDPETAINSLARTEGLLVSAASGDTLNVALRQARKLKPDDLVVVLLKTGMDLDPPMQLSESG